MFFLFAKSPFSDSLLTPHPALFSLYMLQDCVFWSSDDGGLG